MTVTAPPAAGVRDRLRREWQTLPFQGFTYCAGSCDQRRYCAGRTHATMRCQGCYVEHQLRLTPMPGQLELFGGES